MRRRYVTLDVFTAKRFNGNPLAVVFESDGLDTAAMQIIAREFNYPETVFVLPPDIAVQRARLRIFTPARELPFAGHPTVGAAIALARDAGGVTQKFVLGETVGPVVCEVALRDGEGGHASFVLPRLPVAQGSMPDRAALAGALSLAPDDIGGGNLPAARWSAGVTYSFVPVNSFAAITKARPDPIRFEAVLGIDGPAMAYVFCAECAERGSDFHARMFAPAMGIPEDPATGSAAAAFMGLHAANMNLTDGIHHLRIEQGYEISRPSLIDLTMSMAGGKLTAGTIGGDAVIVAEGVVEA